MTDNWHSDTPFIGCIRSFRRAIQNGSFLLDLFFSMFDLLYSMFDLLPLMLSANTIKSNNHSVDKSAPSDGRTDAKYVRTQLTLEPQSFMRDWFSIFRISILFDKTQIPKLFRLDSFRGQTLNSVSFNHSTPHHVSNISRLFVLLRNVFAY